MTMTEGPSHTSVRPRPASRSPQKEEVSPGWIVAFALGAMFIGMAGFVGIVVGAIWLDDDGGAATASTTLNLTVREFAIEGQLVAPAGDVTLSISNTGSMASVC